MYEIRLVDFGIGNLNQNQVSSVRVEPSKSSQRKTLRSKFYTLGISEQRKYGVDAEK